MRRFLKEEPNCFERKARSRRSRDICSRFVVRVPFAFRSRSAWRYSNVAQPVVGAVPVGASASASSNDGDDHTMAMDLGYTTMLPTRQNAVSNGGATPTVNFPPPGAGGPTPTATALGHRRHAASSFHVAVYSDAPLLTR